MPAELRYCAEIRLLRRRRQIADRHVLDHAAAKRADLSHRKTSCLKGWAAKTHDPLRLEAITATAPNCRPSGLVQSPKSQPLRDWVLNVVARNETRQAETAIHLVALVPWHCICCSVL